MTAPSGEFEVVLDIEGMTCASCVDRIENVLNRQPCVAEARVSLAARSAHIRASTSDPAPLILAVEKAGYGAKVHQRDSDPEAEVRDYQRRLIVSIFGSFYVLLLSLILAPGSHSGAVWAWVIATPVIFYSGWPFFRSAVRAARHGTHTMDTLIAAGSLAAYLYSAAEALAGGHHVYFDTAVMIITLVLLGKVLEARARARAGSAARTLLERQATDATLLEVGAERRVPAAELQVGQLVVVRPGERFPADGTVRTGTTTADLSMLTGESLPVDLGPGGEVVGGSVNGPGRLVVELTRVGADTRLAQIVRLLERTQASKAPIQRVADRVAAVFVPRVLQLAALTWFLRLFVDDVGFGQALMYAAAVVLVACPCSLGLATPAAIMAGTGRAAELGILFKGGEVFQATRRIDTVLLDKTGTLTRGAMTLAEVEAAPGEDPDEVLALASAAEAGSEHPIARAVVEGAAALDVAVPGAADFVAEPGMGIRATVDGVRIRVGRPEGLPSSLATRAAELASGGLTVFAVWRDEHPIGLLGAADPVKPGAADAVARMRGWGWEVAVVSGDRTGAVEAVARRVGVDRTVSEVFPEGKVEEIKRLQAEGRRVAFVGDGINDAPALAQADLGIALDTGTDVAMEAGDVLVMGGDLGLVVDGLVLARRTFWVIAQNLAWAFGYNILMIPLAAVGVVSPLVAAGAMAGSSVTVVGNALRLKRYARQREPERAETEVEGLPEPAQNLSARVDDMRVISLSDFLRAWPKPDSEPPRVAAPPPRTREPSAGRTEESEPLGTIARKDARHLIARLGRLWNNQWEA